MKKVLVLFLTSLIVSILFACGHEHVWTDATCTTPKTCSECGETEGEALGHTWVTVIIALKSPTPIKARQRSI